jgi:hypothetical protein
MSVLRLGTFFTCEALASTNVNSLSETIYLSERRRFLHGILQRRPTLCMCDGTRNCVPRFADQFMPNGDLLLAAAPIALECFQGPFVDIASISISSLSLALSSWMRPRLLSRLS